MDRIALQILEDGWEQDARVMRRAGEILESRLRDSTDSRWAARPQPVSRRAWPCVTAPLFRENRRNR